MHLNYELFRANVLVKHVKPYLKTGTTILDFGCGDGIFTAALCRKFRNNNERLSVYGYDIQDLRHAHIKRLRSFRFVSNLFALKERSVDACLIIDVIHHIRTQNNALLGLQGALTPTVRRLKTGGVLIVKDYVIDAKQPFGFLQKLALFTKDVLVNPHEMSKGFNYLTLREWSLLWRGLGVRPVVSQPFYYLPAERYYARITGQAWFWVLRSSPRTNPPSVSHEKHTP